MFFQLLSTFVQAAGAFEKGNASAASAQFNQRISNYNATVTTQEGQIVEQQVRQAGARSIGQMRANIGASGLSSDGSALDILQESAYNAEMDALNTRYNYATKAQAYRMGGELQGMEAKNDKTAGINNAASILMSGYGKARQQSQSDAGYGDTLFKLGA